MQRKQMPSGMPSIRFRVIGRSRRLRLQCRKKWTRRRARCPFNLCILKLTIRLIFNPQESCETAGNIASVSTLGIRTGLLKLRLDVTIRNRARIEMEAENRSSKPYSWKDLDMVGMAVIRVLTVFPMAPTLNEQCGSFLFHTLYLNRVQNIACILRIPEDLFRAD